MRHGWITAMMGSSVGTGTGKIDYQVSVAPMMDWTEGSESGR